MKNRTLIVALLIAALIQACGPQPIQATQEPSATAPVLATAPLQAPSQNAVATQPPTDTPQPPPATDTPPVLTPSQNAQSTLAPTPAPPGSPAMVTPIQDPVNCRYGPSVDFLAIGVGLQVGKSTRIVGKNGDGSFWQVMNPDGLGDVCWVSAVVVTTSGDLSSIQVAPAPAAYVVGVTVTVDPVDNNSSGCKLPTDFRYVGEITASGPMTVQFHWVSSKGNVSSSTKTIVFNSGGYYSFGDTLTASSAGYGYVKMVVTSPGKTIGEGDFKVLCK